jgi:hypothetical protein
VNFELKIAEQGPNAEASKEQDVDADGSEVMVTTVTLADA